MAKKILPIISAAALVLSLAACSKTQSGKVNMGDYVLPTELTEQTTVNYDITKVLDIDTSWQNSYALSYTFYDKNKAYSSNIAEGRCGNYYQSIDQKANIITFLSQEDGYIMEYVLNSESKNGTSAIITDSTMDGLHSGFTMLSACDPYLPVYTNVTRVGDDFVADRPAARYKQVQAEGDAIKKIAYIWIDEQFSFASKCELYDAETEELLMSWELTKFTQNVTENEIKIDISKYKIESK